MKQQTRKLFVISPFSRLESFLSRSYGPEVLFMTRMAGSWDETDSELKELLGELILREGVSEIYLVADAACPMLGLLQAHGLSADQGASQLRQFLQTLPSRLPVPVVPAADCVIGHLKVQLQKLRSGLAGFYPRKAAGLRIHGLLVNLEAGSCELLA